MRYGCHVEDSKSKDAHQGIRISARVIQTKRVERGRNAGRIIGRGRAIGQPKFRAATQCLRHYRALTQFSSEARKGEVLRVSPCPLWLEMDHSARANADV